MAEITRHNWRAHKTEDPLTDEEWEEWLRYSRHHIHDPELVDEGGWYEATRGVAQLEEQRSPKPSMWVQVPPDLLDKIRDLWYD